MLDLKDAQNIAETEVAKIVEADPQLSESEVEKVRLDRENDSVWTFTADVPKLINEGWSPGAITVFVDKNDGHVLSEKEQADLHKDWENKRRRAGFIRQK